VKFDSSLITQASRLIVEGQNARWKVSTGVDKKKNSVDVSADSGNIFVSDSPK
jgi:hypothetical protein